MASGGDSYAKRTLNHTAMILKGYPRTPMRVAKMFFMRRSLQDTKEENMRVSKGEMVRTLGW